MIVGAKKRSQLTENIASTEVLLSDAELRALDEVSELPAEYPGWVFEFQRKVRGDEMAHRGGRRLVSKPP